jgi:hypothetical protein
MKKYVTILGMVLCSIASKSQILGVSLATQEQNEWCWAGCTKSMLNYYGIAVNQCQIADYSRTVATWHSFGTTNCCTNPALGCNYWNYNWGYAGSIQDILTHFGSIVSIGVNSALTTTQISGQIALHHLFVEHWAWSTGGGHFVVGYGISGSGSTASIYYMNPWPGEGMSIGTYTWMQLGVNDMGDHTWDLTNEITSLPVSLSISQTSAIPTNEVVYPNPSTGQVWINASTNSNIEIYSTTGDKVYTVTTSSNLTEIDLAKLAKGLYIVRTNSSEGSTFAKLVLQ